MDEREAKIAYLQHCVSENLNHARHIENERLTFTSIYIAMVIGAVAVVFGLENNWVAFAVALILTVFGLMSMLLNMRWQGVFDDHIDEAKNCHQQWKSQLDNLEVSKELTGRGYYFGQYGKTVGLGQGMRRIVGESTNDAKSHQVDRLKRKYIRQKKSLPYSCLPQKKKKRLEKTFAKIEARGGVAWSQAEQVSYEETLQAKRAICKRRRIFEAVKCFFKEIARTRRIFALLYLLIFLVLVVLTGYLLFEALESATGGGFYFSVEARKELESALTHIVEEVLK